MFGGARGDQEKTLERWSGTGQGVRVQPSAQFPLFSMMVTGYVGNKWQDVGISFMISAVPEGFFTAINGL